MVDPLFDNAVAFTRELGRGSAFKLMERFNIGYSQAVHLMDDMEQAGIIRPLLRDWDDSQLGFGEAALDAIKRAVGDMFSAEELAHNARGLMTPAFAAFLKKYEVRRVHLKAEKEAAREEEARLTGLKQAERAAAAAPQQAPTAAKKSRRKK